MNPKNSAVLVNGLTVAKERQTILNGLTFSLEKGKIFGLIGPSGSGKTTLMRCLVGVQIPTLGSVEILGQPAGSKALRSKVGYVTQLASVYNDLTVKQNLNYFAKAAKAPQGAVESVLATVKLQPQNKQLVSSLSGGQRARVSLAVALLADPEVLILDEPTVGLDPLLRDELWLFFRELAAKGKTLLVSSHVMDEAARCDELLLMRDGRLLMTSTARKLLADTKTKSLEQAFVAVIQSQSGDQS